MGTSQTMKQTIKITADIHKPSEKVMEQEKNVEVNKTISKKEDDGSHSRSVNSMSVKKETVSDTQEVYSSKDKTPIVGENMDNKGQQDKETRKSKRRTKTALPIGTEEDLVIKETPEKQSNGNQKKEIQTSLELKEKESKENKKKENQTSEESNIKESKKNQTSVESTVKESKENKKKENGTSVESKLKGSKGKESENVNK